MVESKTYELLFKAARGTETVAEHPIAALSSWNKMTEVCHDENAATDEHHDQRPSEKHPRYPVPAPALPRSLWPQPTFPQLSIVEAPAINKVNGELGHIASNFRPLGREPVATSL